MSSEVVVKSCDTCSRTFHCKWPDKGVCETWSPDMYAEAEMANGAEAITWEEYHERMRHKSEREANDGGF